MKVKYLSFVWFYCQHFAGLCPFNHPVNFYIHVLLSSFKASLLNWFSIWCLRVKPMAKVCRGHHLLLHLYGFCWQHHYTHTHTHTSPRFFMIQRQATNGQSLHHKMFLSHVRSVDLTGHLNLLYQVLLFPVIFHSVNGKKKKVPKRNFPWTQCNLNSGDETASGQVNCDLCYKTNSSNYCTSFLLSSLL